MSENKVEVTIFNDGSDEFKVLQHECSKNPMISNVNVIPVNQDELNDVEKYFEKVNIENKDDTPTRVWLHFTNTHYSSATGNIPNLANRINKIKSESRGKKNISRLLIFEPYQNMESDHVRFRGIGFGVLEKKEPVKAELVNEEQKAPEQKAAENTTESAKITEEEIKKRKGVK